MMSYKRFSELWDRIVGSKPPVDNPTMVDTCSPQLAEWITSNHTPTSIQDHINGTVMQGISSVRERFMTNYQKDHARCPVCGEVKNSTTLIASVFQVDSPELYEDTNTARCVKCGDEHTVHSRLPL
jgi:ribosomal protein S14